MFSGTLRENIDPFVRYSDAAVAKAVHDCGLQGRSLDASLKCPVKLQPRRKAVGVSLLSLYIASSSSAAAVSAL
jgi:hypothetical protein